jgi:hypothetical protein
MLIYQFSRAIAAALGTEMKTISNMQFSNTRQTKTLGQMDVKFSTIDSTGEFIKCTAKSAVGINWLWVCSVDVTFDRTTQ